MLKRSARFLEELQERVFVCDGAMGTMLYAKGIPLNRCFEEMNLLLPALVKEVHEAYRKAGAEILETNTFGANPVRLATFGLREKCREINQAGVRLARQSSGGETLVAGAVGPLGVRLEPLGPCSPEQARSAFTEQIQALAEAGADLLMLETFYDLDEIREAIAAARSVCDLPLIAQITIGDDGNMPSGTPPEDFTPKLVAFGADAIGCNCSVGPKVILETIQRMAPLSPPPLTAQPNAGLPVNVAGRNIYLCSPEYIAGYVSHFLRNGVKLVGGCCGTTPEHIRAIQEAVQAVQSPRPRIGWSAVPAALEPEKLLDPIPLPERSRLAHKIASGQFVVMAEVIPSHGADPTKEIEGARYLAGAGLDAVLVRDGWQAGARMSAQVLAHLIQDRVGIETVLQYSCRDRNVVSIQSDILGAYGLGLRNLVLVTGGPSKKDNYPDATAVFDVDAIGLTKIVANLNRGLDLGGNFLGSRTSFCIAVSANPGAVNLEREIERLETKVQVGAECVVTQPVFDLEQLERFLERTRPLGIPLVAGVYPLTSLHNAEFLANELQIPIPAPLLERMKIADCGQAARTEGIRIAQEILAWLQGRVQGVLLSAPLGRYGSAVEILAALGSRDQNTMATQGIPVSDGPSRQTG
ncbi:MAG: bifunctional homocysteine S-methyltransferase/methylenetetrahydrofolate reductase [Acidobacteria bacterium]|nr:bifunctional homocysteine S-methyltransferase/methylenetetrahydrofolate reductase [Acidobacteriota bacterium]